MTTRHPHGRASVWRLHPTQRGTSLIEALVAMAVMAFGMLAVVGVQSTLRMNADIAKQRSEATRLADAEMERMRTFVSADAVDGAPMGWDEIVAAEPDAPALVSTNASYFLQRTVVNLPGSEQKAISVVITWEDRFGATQRLMMRSIVAAAAPGLSGLLSVRPTRTAATQRNNRHPTIPPRARDTSGGESVFKPREGGTVAWAFNNTTGVITRICIVAASSTSETLAEDEELLTGCVTTSAQLLSGYVRFNLAGVANRLSDSRSVYKPSGDDQDLAWVINNSTGAIVRQCDVGGRDTEDIEDDDLDDCESVNPSQPISPFNAATDDDRALTAADSDDPHWPAMPLSVPLTLDASHVTGSICYAESLGSMEDAMRLFSVEYFCIIMPKAGDNPDGLWSGHTSLNVSNWSFGNDRDEIRSCRYTLANGDVTDNADHPRNYTNVAGNLINQNFLVVNGTKACPTDVAADPITGDFINSNTRQHQPAS